MRVITNGSAVANVVLATSDSWMDKRGAKQERTEWHRIVMFNKLAEIAGKYLKKGSKVYIKGSLRTRKWQDNNGADKYTTEIVASEMQMLDSRDEMNAGADPAYPPADVAQPAAPADVAQPAAPSGGAPQSNPASSEPPPFASDDDLPF